MPKDNRYITIEIPTNEETEALQIRKMFKKFCSLSKEDLLKASVSVANPIKWTLIKQYIK